MSTTTITNKIYSLYTEYEFHFIVLGAGGTGSELIPKLCRQLSFKRDSLGNQTHTITLCDGDKVEEKNIKRQNFFLSDIGKNKAEVMAIKCGTLFNLTISTFDSYIESEEALSNIINMYPHKIPFIVGCVDNNATRAMLHKYFTTWRKLKPIFYLDCGNEEFSGQVVLGCRISGGKTVQAVDVLFNDGFYTKYLFTLPDVCGHYPDMLESKEVFSSELSCAERAISNPQAYDTNIQAACVAYQMISNCLRGSIDYHKVTFNVLKGNSHTSFNTEDFLIGEKINLAKANNMLDERNIVASKAHKLNDPDKYKHFCEHQKTMAEFYGEVDSYTESFTSADRDIILTDETSEDSCSDYSFPADLQGTPLVVLDDSARNIVRSAVPDPINAEEAFNLLVTDSEV